MAVCWFTIAGMNHRYGTDIVKVNDTIQLVKEPDNEADNEAIMVRMDGLGKIGYVANSVYTRLGETMSAGRLYDRFGDRAEATVAYVTGQGVIGKLVTPDDGSDKEAE